MSVCVLIDRIIELAGRYPDKPLFIDGGKIITRAEFVANAQRVATGIRMYNVGTGRLLPIILPDSADYITAVVGVWMSGNAAVHLSDSYPEERIDYVLKDTNASLVIDKAFMEKVPDFRSVYERIERTEDMPCDMFYTSGSTGKPKGVLHSDRAIVESVMRIASGLDWRENDIVGWVQPMHFIAVAFLYHAVCQGAKIHVVGETVRKSVAALEEYLVKHRITALSTTPSVLRMLDTSNAFLRIVNVGSERVTNLYSDTYKLMVTYGQTESALLISAFEVDRPYENTPVGKVIEPLVPVILDEEGREVLQGEEGELCLKGITPPVYWNDPEKTAVLTRGGVFHTGDIVKMQPDGNLIYINRADWMVKIDGQRVEPGEVEEAMRNALGIDQVVVKGFTASDRVRQYLVGYYVAGKEIEETHIHTELTKTLPAYMIPAQFVRLDEIPMLPNGKTDRQALTDPARAYNTHVRPETEMEQKLFDFLVSILGTDAFGVTTNLIRLGLTSLLAMKLSKRIWDAMHIQTVADTLLNYKTIRSLAEYLQTLSAENVQEAKAKQTCYPVTENQRGLYIEWEKDNSSTQYNCPFVFAVKDASPEQLRAALETVWTAHPALKTRLVRINGVLMQQRRDEDPVAVSMESFEGTPDAAFFQSRVRPFDLLKDALYRIEIYAVERSLYLFMDIHHIIFDGLSNNVLLADLKAVLTGKEIIGEEYTAFDAALEERAWMASEHFGQAQDYFDQLTEKAAVASYPHSTIPETAGSSANSLKEELAAQPIYAFCRREGVTASSYFITAFTQVLHRILREEDLMIVAASNGRYLAQMHNLTGMFVRTLPVVSRASCGTTAEAVRALQAQHIETQSHGRYPYSHFVSRHRKYAEILFAYQGGVFSEGEKDDILDASEYPLHFTNTKMPITFQVRPQGNRFVLELEYDTSLYNRADMCRLLDAVCCFAENAADSEQISSVPMVNDAQYAELIRLGRGRSLNHDRSLTLVDLFRHRVEQTPDNIAVVFREKRYTYRELDHITSRLAAYLQKQFDVAPEQVVGVMIDRSELMAIYPLAIMKAGAAYMPLDFEFSAKRLEYMCKDAGVSLILSEGNRVKEAIPEYEGKIFLAGELETLPMDEHLDACRQAKPQNMFVVLYTSGTTGNPKGVVLEHSGIVNYCHWYLDEFGLTEDDRVVAYANFGFDAHMIDLYPTFFAGASVYILDSAIRRNLIEMERYIRDNALTTAFMTTVVGREFASTLTNHSLRVLSIGGEKLKPIKKPDFRLYNVYGPTETTLFATAYSIETDYNSSLIGKALANYQLYIVDSSMQLVPRGIPGELIIAGAGVGRGYLNQPAAEKKFINFMGERAYRTGDLVCWSDDGNIAYLGRMDNQVKLDGLRIELEEIESRAVEYEGITACAAAVKVVNDTKQLCCYYTADRKINISGLKLYLQDTLAAFMIPKHFIAIDAIPVTPNGKVDRGALPMPALTAEEAEWISPSTKKEQQLFDIAQELLGTNAFGVTTDLTTLGLSSFLTTLYSARIRQRMGIDIPFGDIGREPTIRALATIADSCTFYEGKTAYPLQKYYPLCENQLGIYLDWERNREATQYNIPLIWKFENVTAETLGTAVEQVMQAHPYLKTQLVKQNGRIVQMRSDDAEVMIRTQKLDYEIDTAYFAQRVRPFDILNGALYRFEICETPTAVWLFADIHHIIFDGMSAAIFGKDLTAALRGEQLQPENYSGYDVALDEAKAVGTEDYRLAENYFDALIDEKAGTAYPRSVLTDTRKPSAQYVQAEVEAADITAFCRKHAVTENSYFMTCVCQVLHRIMREDKLMIAAVSNGRNIAEMLSLTGMFVKTLPVVSVLSKNTVAAAVRQMQTQFLMTQENSVYPYTKMVSKHEKKAQIMFVYQGGVMTEEMQELPVGLDTVKFPLMITVIPHAESFGLTVEYDPSIYSSQEMRRLLNAVKCYAEFASVGNAACSTIPLISKEEQNALIKLGTGKKIAYDPSETFVDLLVKQAALTPDALAVADGSGRYTYREVDEASNALAHELLTQGIQSGDFVGLLLDRTKYYPMCVFSIHKAGAAYLPLDLEYPNGRLNEMIADAQPRLVITTRKALSCKRQEGSLALNGDRIVYLEELDLTVNTAPVNRAVPKNPAYMIYTSGSTGKSKGSVLHHNGLRNYIASMTDVLELTAADRISIHRPFSFDAHIQDLYPVLTVGGSIHVMPEEIRKDLRSVYNFILEHGITGGSYTTSMGAMLLDYYKDTLPLRYLTCTGEKMMGLVSGTVQLYNGYGPTECTDLISVHKLQRGKSYKDIPIGRPMANSHCFLLDTFGQLLPRGSAGELCFASIQVSSGYWKLPALTEKVFGNCPFVEGKRMYHTGDLCRWNEDGELEYLGRIDNQVKLRGFRIELGEIESEALKLTGIQEAAALVKRINESDQLVLYYTLKEGTELSTADLRSALKNSALAQYMIPECYMEIAEMPKTRSGKIDRKLLPVPEICDSEIVEPSGETERALYAVAKELLPKSRFGVTTDLRSVGLESIKAMHLSERISQKLGIYIPSEMISKKPTLRALAEIMKRGMVSEEKAAYPKQRSYPLCENQYGIYVDWSRNRNTTQYNVPSVYKVHRHTAEEMKTALLRVVSAHPHLKTRLAAEDNQVVQLRCEGEEVSVLVAKLQKEPDRAFFQSRVRPFDLLKDQLCRFEIYAVDDALWLFMDIHHIIFDGLSQGIFMKDLEAVLRGEIIKEEFYTAFDAALDEEQWMNTKDYQEAERYFDDLLTEAAVASYPVSGGLDLTETGLEEITIRFEGSEITAFCRRNGVTENSFFMMATTQVLHRLQTGKKLMIASISHGRNRKEKQDITGMFVKTLPVVSQSSKASAAETVKQMQDQYIQTQKYQDYPYTHFVKRHQLSADVMYVYQGGVMDKTDNANVLEEAGVLLSLNCAKAPITVQVFPEEGQFSAVIGYDPFLYCKADMQRFAGFLKNFAQSAASAACPCSQIPLLAPEEQAAVIEMSKGKVLHYDKDETFVSVFAKRARENPDAVAVVDAQSTITYQELDRASNALAHQLMALGVKRNDFVAVMLPRRKEFFVSVLGIQKAGAAYVPIDREYPNERVSFILQNAGAKVVIDESFVFQSEDISEVNLAAPDSYAYMIYTSGSTGRPKGVCVCHRAITACAAWNIPEFGLAPGKRNLHHPSFSFDASTFDLFYPLMAGATVYIADEALRVDLKALADYSKANRITGMTVSTAFGMMLLNAYDLELEYIMLGGEKLLPVKKSGIRLYNGYGPTEFTVCSSYHRVNWERDTAIPIGNPVPNTYSFICDTEGQLLPQGTAGELCLMGAQMAEGYWHLPEKTAEVFVPCTFLGGEKMYRTGDLACYNHDGELEYLGRIDRQVKIDGYRVEFGEIESRAAGFAGVEQAVAAVKELGTVKQLCLYYRANSEVDTEALRAYLAAGLAEYMVPKYFVMLDSMPMTPNGKIDTAALPMPKRLSVDDEIIPPSTQTEQKLFDIAKELLGTSIFGVTTNLISLNLNSLQATELSERILRKLGIYISANNIKKAPTIRALAAIAESGTAAKKKAPHPMRDAYPLCDNQLGIYLAWENDRDATQYNIPIVRKYEDITAEALSAALIRVMQAHPYLKTQLAERNGHVIQMRNDDAETIIMSHQLDHEIDAAFFATRVRPFDILNEALYRFELWTTPGAVWLFMDIHHIIFDGMSVAIFEKDLSAALRGEQLQPEDYSAYDVALDEAETAESESYKRAESYFDTLIEEKTVASYSPSAQPDTPKPSAHYVQVDISGGDIVRFCRKNAVTEHSYFMTCVCQLLHRFIRKDALMIASVSNGRDTAEMLPIIGMFVKTLPVVSVLSKDTVAAAARQMQEQFLQTQMNSVYPYTKLASKHGKNAQIMFVYQGGVTTGEMQELPGGLDTVKFPLMITAVPKADNFTLMVEYDASLYACQDMQLLAKSLKAYAENAAIGEKYCDSVPLIDHQEAQRLTIMGKGRDLPLDPAETLVDLFRRQAKATPHANAVVFRERSYSYSQIDTLTDCMAIKLASLGVKQETVVGVMIDRSEWMILYPLAIMKAGGAYMPLDCEFPEKRLSDMCNAAGVNIILGDEGLVEHSIPHYNGISLCQKDFNNWDVTQDEVEALPVAAPENMCIVLYTSGSTGTPKGCVLEHRNITNFCHWYVNEFDVTAKDHAMAYANFGFDAHMMDIYPALSAGACVYVIPTQMRMDLQIMNDYMEQEQISIAFMTTQIGYLFATRSKNKSLRLLSVGGEKLRPMKKPRFRFYNGYGPTECTMFSTCYAVTEDYNSSVIGRPLAGYQLYVVDAQLNLVPCGVPGELIVAGAGVGRGYLNPRATDEKFIVYNGQRAYRTGDMVRWSEDGNLEFLGRDDHQVKLRGLRIELGEIEACASKYKGIFEVCVAVRKIAGADNLVCYYTEDRGAQVSEEALKQHLEASLPAFMIPKSYVKLDTIPLTPNGKVNYSELPVPKTGSTPQYKAPGTEDEKLFCDIFAKILGLSKVGIEDDYFRLGGTSMSAIEIAFAANQAGRPIVYKDVYDHPTPKELAALLGKGGSCAKKVVNDTVITDFDYDKIQRVLERNTRIAFEEGKLLPIGEVLLTGATGFLGIHVLHELLMNCKDVHVCCLIRSKENESAHERLKKRFLHYFSIDIFGKFGNRLKVIEADITDKASLERIETKIDTVINCAANVKHFSHTGDIEAVNADGVVNLIELCLRRDARLVQISTTSVGEMQQTEDGIPAVMTEQMLYFGQYFGNKYCRSKFMAERHILENIAEKGLKAKIIRVGNLSPRASDGRFQINYETNAAMGRLKILNVLSAISEEMSRERIEFSPVDDVARCVVLLAQTPHECCLFHSYHPHTMQMADVVMAMNQEGLEIHTTEDALFKKHLEEEMRDTERRSLFTSLLAYYNVDEHMVMTQADNVYTTDILDRMGFGWSECSDTYVCRFVKALKHLGYFK